MYTCSNFNLTHLNLAKTSFKLSKVYVNDLPIEIRSRRQDKQDHVPIVIRLN